MKMKRNNNIKIRFPWPGTPLILEYHDPEWGVPIYNDRQLFEFLILEGAQSTVACPRCL
ncbi:MAG: 3-methyl-adenine DNA glycosylase I [Methanobacterium sp. PtaU1.Bin242]|nr:MAG: 3-methyl-adenine DNA glycosylase I [Methanobacterium sp. PtaU1.Bin242]